MATTVNKAFEEFMKDSVNLDPDIVAAARRSRDNLLDNIAEFSDQNGFFTLCEKYNVHFGSFARKTKCRELDDIDLMIGISGNGAVYNGSDPWENIRIYSNSSDSAQFGCTRDDGTLNSTLVLNRFKKALSGVREYLRSELRRNQEAIVLNLISKEWSFDIVPCFHTAPESDGRSFYLIPNGNGNWKKTNPIVDRDHIQNTNQNHEGRVLELIRLFKKWNKVNNTKTMPSYLLETMIINYCDSVNEMSKYIDIEFKQVLNYIANHIMDYVSDLKGIQGNINELSISERISIQNKARTDYEKACTAVNYETTQKDMKKSIGKWGEILGSDFPEYSE